VRKCLRTLIDSRDRSRTFQGGDQKSRNALWLNLPLNLPAPLPFYDYAHQRGFPFTQRLTSPITKSLVAVIRINGKIQPRAAARETRCIYIILDMQFKLIYRIADRVQISQTFLHSIGPGKFERFELQLFFAGKWP